MNHRHGLAGLEMSGSKFSERRLAEFDFGPVRQRVMAEQGWDGAAYGRYETELRRFFTLVGTRDEPLAVLSLGVDAIWHQIVLFTPLYRKFCKHVFGHFVDHVPRTEFTPIPVAAINNLVNAYTERYGSLDPVWLEDLPPQDKALIAQARAPADLAFQWSGWPGRVRRQSVQPQE